MCVFVTPQPLTLNPKEEWERWECQKRPVSRCDLKGWMKDDIDYGGAHHDSRGYALDHVLRKVSSS